MFVSGETGDVSPETTSMIESIVQQQVCTEDRTKGQTMVQYSKRALREARAPLSTALSQETTLLSSLADSLSFR